MSASIPSLLADKLDVSDQKAKKLLLAMLREVKKRAYKEGVRLPEFGTFREHNGELTFEPSPSLARSVNRQFEGLESEELGTAPSQESKKETSDGGPDTITLGYQDSDWTPLDSNESDDEASSEESDEPDTAEFQVPSAEDAADTDELQTPAPQEPTPDAEDPSPTQEQKPEPTPTPSSSTDDSGARDASAQTEELYPLVEDVPADEEEDDKEEDDEEEKDEAASFSNRQVDEDDHSSLSGIWDSDEESDESEDEFDPYDPDSEPFSTSEPAAAPEPTAEADSSTASSGPSPDAEPTSEVDISPEAQDSPPSPEPDEASPSKDSGSSSARILVGVLVLLLLGGAGWYLLGQRGLVPSPQNTFAQLQSQARGLPLVGSTSEDTDGASSTSSTTATDDGDTQTSSPSASGTDAGSGSQSTTSSTSSSDAAPTQDTEQTSSRTLTPSAGGWTVVVASRSAQSPAKSLVANYQDVFSDRNLPIGTITGEVDGETRYRIGVGQFSSRSQAETFIEEAGNKLPEGAWLLRL